ncbi:CLUMA_CG020333, isoform A [Clunio marinus]|uniref:CLUMA_CG020333, isoform A n=1 Tax=Clunio marinus TaxID=568069 RepID=A0A1J1J4N0_9DIPT|nr:CLUMA_CG020333, isoform A [Clunio marinus]
MACRLIKSSLVLWNLSRKHSLHYGATYSAFVFCRQFHIGETYFKRRKTKEERKAPKIIEYSPKKQHDPNSEFVEVWRSMTVDDLSKSCDRDLELVQEAMLYVKGAPDINPETRLEDINIIKEIVKKFGMRIKTVGAPGKEKEIEKDRDVFKRPPAKPEDLKPRAPVVTVMGHVDHGKTTLLDTLRGASVAQSEAGGITQHIGAFTVELNSEENITFLDTPGHAAFSAMRARGANITDIIVLVVAAEDGVMEQTKEVAALAQRENVPIIVAINKIDKPEADPEKTKRELAQLGINLEGHGGDTQFVCISAKYGTNLEELVEAISTQATLMGLTSDFTGLVEGVVVESSTDARRGKLSTAIVTRGTLRRGAVLVSGCAWAKVRALFDHAGHPVDAVVPGMPVEILGWRELPEAGDEIIEVESEKVAHSVMRWRQAQHQRMKAESEVDVIKQKQMEHYEKYKSERDARRKLGKFKSKRIGPRTKENIGDDDGIPRINVIIKGDVHGSVEAILDVLETYHDNDIVKLDVVHYGVGDVNEGDVELAKLSNAIIYAFSVNHQKVTIPANVKLQEVNIIYRLVDHLKKEINSKIPPVDVEEFVGEANVLQIFQITEGRKEVTVLGCRCTKGVLKKNQKYRLMRHDEVIYEGQLESMRHLKTEVDTIKNNLECGLRFCKFDVEAKPGDTLTCYTIVQEAQETTWDPGF